MKKYYCKFELDESGFYGDVYQDSDFSRRIGYVDINVKKYKFSAIHVDGIGFEWLTDFVRFLNLQSYDFVDREGTILLKGTTEVINNEKF